VSRGETKYFTEQKKKDLFTTLKTLKRSQKKRRKETGKGYPKSEWFMSLGAVNGAQTVHQ